MDRRSSEFVAEKVGFLGDRTVVIGLVVICLIMAWQGLSLLKYYTEQSQLEKKQSSSIVTVERDAPIEMVNVLIPIGNINPGEPLEPGLFRDESRALNSLGPKQVQSRDEIKGKYSRTMILAGQPLYADFITEVRPINQVTASIPPEYRAVSITVDATSSVEGWARAGSRVDILWIGKVKGVPTASVVIQNAKILSAERMSEAVNTMPTHGNQMVPATVTLLVTTPDSSKMQLAQRTGRTELLLRGDRDGLDAYVNGRTVSVADLLQGSTKGVFKPMNRAVIPDGNGGQKELLFDNEEGLSFLEIG